LEKRDGVMESGLAGSGGALGKPENIRPNFEDGSRAVYVNTKYIHALEDRFSEPVIINVWNFVYLRRLSS
jgi:hypothetical protein